VDLAQLTPNTEVALAYAEELAKLKT